MTGEEGHVTSLTSWRAACDISARSFGVPTIYERPMIGIFKLGIRYSLQNLTGRSVIRYPLLIERERGVKIVKILTTVHTRC